MVENVENILVLLSQQNYLDITVYVFIVYFLFLGWKRGAIYQIYYLFSLLMAISLSFRYSFDIGLYISNWLNSNLQLSEIFWWHFGIYSCVNICIILSKYSKKLFI
jgi:uncharacterized membrane protein required for colicin V production